MIFSKKLSENLTSTMITSNIITEKEKTIYIYCFDYIFELAFVFLSFLLIGAFSNRLIYSCIFLLVVFPLRSYGGGIHASNSTVCTYLSYTIYIITIFISPILSPVYSTEWMVLLVVECVVIVLFAPVDTPNKRLTAEQRVISRHISRLLTLTIFIISFLLYLYKLRLYYGTISICGIIPSTSIVLGYINNKRKEASHAV